METLHDLTGHAAKTKTQISYCWVKPLIFQNPFPNQLWLCTIKWGTLFRKYILEEEQNVQSKREKETYHWTINDN